MASRQAEKRRSLGMPCTGAGGCGDQPAHRLAGVEQGVETRLLGRSRPATGSRAGKYRAGMSRAHWTWRLPHRVSASGTGQGVQRRSPHPWSEQRWHHVAAPNGGVGNGLPRARAAHRRTLSGVSCQTGSSCCYLHFQLSHCVLMASSQIITVLLIVKCNRSRDTAIAYFQVIVGSFGVPARALPARMPTTATSSCHTAS